MSYVVSYETPQGTYEVPVKTEDCLAELQRVIREFPQVKSVMVHTIPQNKEK